MKYYKKHVFPCHCDMGKMVKCKYETKQYFTRNYTSNERPYQLKLPIELSTIIPDNDSVRLFRQIICQLDLKQLYALLTLVCMKIRPLRHRCCPSFSMLITKESIRPEKLKPHAVVISISCTCSRENLFQIIPPLPVSVLFTLDHAPEI